MILDLRYKNIRPIFQTCNLLPRLEMFESSLAYISNINFNLQSKLSVIFQS